ncbi:MAG: hypothetical protein WCG06_02970, partial [Candidatus Omnitrophota bacterium]
MSGGLVVDGMQVAFHGGKVYLYFAEGQSLYEANLAKEEGLDVLIKITGKGAQAKTEFDQYQAAATQEAKAVTAAQTQKAGQALSESDQSRLDQFAGRFVSENKQSADFSSDATLEKNAAVQLFARRTGIGIKAVIASIRLAPTGVETVKTVAKPQVSRGLQDARFVSYRQHSAYAEARAQLSAARQKQDTAEIAFWEAQVRDLGMSARRGKTAGELGFDMSRLTALEADGALVGLFDPQTGALYLRTGVAAKNIGKALAAVEHEATHAWLSAIFAQMGQEQKDALVGELAQRLEQPMQQLGGKSVLEISPELKTLQARHGSDREVFVQEVFARLAELRQISARAARNQRGGAIARELTELEAKELAALEQVVADHALGRALSDFARTYERSPYQAFAASLGEGFVHDQGALLAMAGKKEPSGFNPAALVGLTKEGVVSYRDKEFYRWLATADAQQRQQMIDYIDSLQTVPRFINDDMNQRFIEQLLKPLRRVSQPQEAAAVDVKAIVARITQESNAASAAFEQADRLRREGNYEEAKKCVESALAKISDAEFKKITKGGGSGAAFVVAVNGLRNVRRSLIDLQVSINGEQRAAEELAAKKAYEASDEGRRQKAELERQTREERLRREADDAAQAKTAAIARARELGIEGDLTGLEIEDIRKRIKDRELLDMALRAAQRVGVTTDLTGMTDEQIIAEVRKQVEINRRAHEAAIERAKKAGFTEDLSEKKTAEIIELAQRLEAANAQSQTAEQQRQEVVQEQVQQQREAAEANENSAQTHAKNANNLLRQVGEREGLRKQQEDNATNIDNHDRADLLSMQNEMTQLRAARFELRGALAYFRKAARQYRAIKDTESLERCKGEIRNIEQKQAALGQQITVKQAEIDVLTQRLEELKEARVKQQAEEEVARTARSVTVNEKCADAEQAMAQADAGLASVKSGRVTEAKAA